MPGILLPGLRRFYANLADIHNDVSAPIQIADTTSSSKTDDFGITAPFHWHAGLTQQVQADRASGVLALAYATSWIMGLTWTHDDSDDPGARWNRG